MTSGEAEALGRLIGILLFPLLLFLAAFWLWRRRKRFWWIHLAVGVLAVAGLIVRSVPPPARDPASLFAPIPGYEFQPLPPDLERTAIQNFRAVVARSSVDIMAIEVREVLTDGEHIGSVLVISVDPGVAKDDDFLEEVADGFESAGGTQPVSCQWVARRRSRRPFPHRQVRSTYCYGNGTTSSE